MGIKARFRYLLSNSWAAALLSKKEPTHPLRDAVCVWCSTSLLPETPFSPPLFYPTSVSLFPPVPVTPAILRQTPALCHDLAMFSQVKTPWTSPWPWCLFRLPSCPGAACQRASRQPSLSTGGSVSMAKQPGRCTQALYWQHLPRGGKHESILNLKILHGFQVSWMYSPASCDYHFAACCWLPKSHANRLEDVGSVKNTLPHVQLEPSIIPYKSSSKKWKREVIIIFNINSNY